MPLFKLIMWVGLLACAAAASGDLPAVSPPWRIVGYNDMEEMLVALTDAYSARDGGVPITLVLKGTRTAPPALADGSSVLAPMGAEMSDDELASYRRLRGNDPVEIRVAHDSLKHDSISSPTGIFVNAENPLRRISLDQLRHVFAASPTISAISRWGQLGLGGPWTNRPIDAAGLGPKTAIGRHLLRYVLRSDRYVDRFGGGDRRS